MCCERKEVSFHGIAHIWDLGWKGGVSPAIAITNDGRVLDVIYRIYSLKLFHQREKYHMLLEAY